MGKDNRWRVVKGYAGKVWWAWYVVRGKGTDPAEVDFDYHGAYILESAARGQADALNNCKKSEKYIGHKPDGITKIR